MVSFGSTKSETAAEKRTVIQGVLYQPGEEPENIRARLDRVFEKLDAIYPDKVVIGLHSEHKNLGETITELYRKLGYPDGNAFLRAYGYTTRSKAGGRPTNNHSGIVNELRQRYRNGAICTTIEDLLEKNPDIAPKIRTLRDQAKDLFGMSLKKYFVQEGILAGKTDERCKEEFETLKSRYAGRPYMGTVNGLIEENQDLDWDAINKYCIMANPEDTRMIFLQKEGILATNEDSAKSRLSAITEELKKRYPAEKMFSGTIERLKRDNSDLPLSNISTLIRQVYHIAPTEYFTQQGIMEKPKSIEEKLADVTEALKKKYVAGDQKACSVADLRAQNPDLPIDSIGGWAKKVFGQDAFIYLDKQGIIPMRNRVESIHRMNERMGISNHDFRIVGDFAIDKINANTLGIIGYIGHDKRVVIPNIPNVTAIGTNAFAGNSDIEILDLSAITCGKFYLSDKAFRSCENLTSIVLPKNEGADINFNGKSFVGCTKLADANGLIIVDDVLYGVIQNGEDIRDIVVPAGVRKIADRAFSGNSCISKVSFPESLEEIGELSFSSTGLTKIRLPAQLKRIGNGAFDGNKFETIRIPKNVETAQGFCHSYRLRDVVIENGVQHIGSFTGCNRLRKIELPESITEIPPHTFGGCDSLRTIVIHAPECSLDPAMLTDWNGNDWSANHKLRIVCSERVAKGAPENFKRFCVVEERRFESNEPLYYSLDRLDLDRMIHDVAPKYTPEKPVTPRATKRILACEGVDFQLKLRLGGLDSLHDALYYNKGYDFRTASENLLSAEEVIHRMIEEDPAVRDENFQFVRPEVNPNAPTASRETKERGFLFLLYIAFCLSREDVQKEIIAAMPKKKDGSFHRGRILRIVCAGVVANGDMIPQIVAKADTDECVTISVVNKPVSEDELNKTLCDFVSTHKELFHIPSYWAKQ